MAVEVSITSAARIMNESALRADIELRLRRNGIRVDDKSPNVFRVSLTLVEGSTVSGVLRSYAAGIHAVFVQPVVTIKQPDVYLLGTTWDRLIVETSDYRSAEGYFRQTIRDLSDIFANDFLAANSK